MIGLHTFSFGWCSSHLIIMWKGEASTASKSIYDTIWHFMTIFYVTRPFLSLVKNQLPGLISIDYNFLCHQVFVRSCFFISKDSIELKCYLWGLDRINERSSTYAVRCWRKQNIYFLPYVSKEFIDNWNLWYAKSIVWNQKDRQETNPLQHSRTNAPF